VLNGSTGERVGIKPVYKTTSDPTVKANIEVVAGKPTSSSVTTRTGAVNEKGDVTFPVLNAGQSVTVAGLTYTATTDRTDAQVAAAFVGLADGATTGTGTANGTYSGKMVNWSTTGNTVSGTSTLTFNSSTPITNVTDLVATATPTLPTVVTTQGIAAAVTELADVTFKDLAAGQSVQVAGLTLTATSAKTAAEVATAFASVNSGATSGNAAGGISFTGTLTGYNSGAVGGAGNAVVRFTSTSVGAVVTDISVTTTSNNSPTVAITQGTPTVTETSDITFGSLTNGQSVVLNGLKFTANRSVSSAEVAAAFASLAANATTGPATSYGAYTGTLTGFSTGAVLPSGIAVKATSSTGTTNVTDITVGPTPLPTISKTDGVAGTLDGVTEESVLTFPAMSKGQTITVAGLTYTATVANSGAEVAAAFANLASGAPQAPAPKVLTAALWRIQLWQSYRQQ
jgi:hypothetical protein